MKKGVIILNFARDLLVDEKAVVDAIAAGKVRKYVTDFPNPTTAGAEGVIATPHLGASTEEAEDNCAAMAASEMKEFLTNGNIENSVNFPNVTIARSTGARVTVLHKNKVGMIEQITNKIDKETAVTISALTIGIWLTNSREFFIHFFLK